MPRQLVFIFTRDFSLWANEIIRHAYVDLFPTFWGKGLEDQIVHYDGRTGRWYRYQDDFAALGDFMVHKDLDDPLFQKENHHQFRTQANELRAFLTTPYESIWNKADFYQQLKAKFLAMYPYYTFSVFFAGAWREKFLQFRGEGVKNIVDMVYESRVQTEGLLKLCDLFLRDWLSPLLKKHGVPGSFIKLLREEEIGNLVEKNMLPSASILEERNKGYVFWRNSIFLTTDLEAFLREHNLALEETPLAGSTALSGTVARKGGIITGPVKVVFNSEEIKNFSPGCILVTPMTSPEYLPALKVAKAIITDEGGLTCHAAIVARELNVPCIIGTKIATRVLKDGDRVEVDADHGIVRRL